MSAISDTQMRRRERAAGAGPATDVSCWEGECNVSAMYGSFNQQRGNVGNLTANAAFYPQNA